MTMSTSVAQMRIAREMRDAESALDDSLLKQSSLLGTMLTARRATGSQPFLGQESLMRLAKSQQTLVSAGNDLARVHGNLLQVQEEITGYESCPEAQPMARDGQHLPAAAA